MGCAIKTIPFNGIFAIECVVSIALLAVDYSKFTAVLQYFLNSFFIFSQWVLIFDITKFNTSLYRFLLKVLKIVGYSSIAFLVSSSKRL